MSGPTSSVTPLGVRDGHPDALSGLARRRSGSVVDYMRLACGSEAVVMDAAAETFARFRGAVIAAEDPFSLAPDPLLLSCTRHSAAAMTQVVARTADCHATPFLLVGEYEGVNAPTDRARLTRHLATCASCTTMSAGFTDAEAAFRAPHQPEADTAIVARIIAALEAAGPVRRGDADAAGAIAVPIVDVPQDEPAPPPAEPEEEPEAPLPDDEDYDDYDEEPFADDDFDVPAAESTDAAPPLVADESEDVARRYVLPAAIVAAGIISAMTIAGVFGGTSPAPARGTTDLPAIAPPKRPPPADDETQAAAETAAREALRRIEARDRRTTVEAERQRRLEAAEKEQEAQQATPDPSTAAPDQSADDETATPDPEPTPRPGSGPEGEEEARPETDAGDDAEGSVGAGAFEPQATPTP